MYTTREKNVLGASVVLAAIVAVVALVASCGWLASGGDRYRLFGANFNSRPWSDYVCSRLLMNDRNGLAKLGGAPRFANDRRQVATSVLATAMSRRPLPLGSTHQAPKRPIQRPR